MINSPTIQETCVQKRRFKQLEKELLSTQAWVLTRNKGMEL